SLAHEGDVTSRLRWRVLNLHQAGATSRTLADAEDAPVASLGKLRLGVHGHRNTETLRERGGAVGERLRVQVRRWGVDEVTHGVHGLGDRGSPTDDILGDSRVRHHGE